MTNTTKVGLMAAMLVLGLLAFSGSASAFRIVTTGPDNITCVQGETTCVCVQNSFSETGGSCHDKGGWECLVAHGETSDAMDGYVCHPSV